MRAPLHPTFPLWLTIVTALTGCAGKPMTRGGLPPAEPPESYVQKFDVKEHTGGEVAVTPSPSPAPEAKVEKVSLTTNTRRRHHHKLVEVEPSPSPSLFPLPNRRPTKDPLWIGEKLDYEVTFWGMAAADVTIELLPFKEVNGHKVYHIRGNAHSSKVFNLFYHIDDMAETFVDYESLLPFRFHLVQEETRQTRDALELYDHENRQTYYWNRFNHYQRGYLEAKEYGKMEPLSQDSVSALFYVRTLPLPDGAVITFPVASEAKGWEMVITVVRREMLDTPMGRIRTVVIKPEAKFHGVMEKKGDSYIWLTDDDRHLLVRMEAKVRIGTVVARLKKVESLGNPP